MMLPLDTNRRSIRPPQIPSWIDTGCFATGKLMLKEVA